MARVKVKVETKRITPKVRRAAKKSRQELGQQVLKDSNIFIPYAEGDLLKSGIRASQLEKGKLVWDMPYARKLYYGVRFNFSKDVNPQAGPLWYERAQMVYGAQWVLVAERAVKSNL